VCLARALYQCPPPLFLAAPAAAAAAAVTAGMGAGGDGRGGAHRILGLPDSVSHSWPSCLWGCAWKQLKALAREKKSAKKALLRMERSAGPAIKAEDPRTKGGLSIQRY
jgi:hypothetical protein